MKNAMTLDEYAQYLVDENHANGGYGSDAIVEAGWADRMLDHLDGTDGPVGEDEYGESLYPLDALAWANGTLTEEAA